MPQIAELKEIDGSIWARVPMELGSPVQILDPSEIEANREREIRYLDEIERLNMAEDLLGCALSHLEGDPCYANKQAIIDYLKAYFDFKKSGRSPLVHQQNTGE